MRRSLSEFTESERQIINDIHKREFADMTPDEVKLYGEWQLVRGMFDAEIEARREALEKQTQESIELHRREMNASLEALEAMKNEALARLEAVKNGQQE